MVRAAARRRAVRLALVAGAVFLLGLLCGERAAAADGPPQQRFPSGAGPVRVDTEGVRSLVDALTAPGTDVAAPTRSRAEGAVRGAARERGVRFGAGSGSRAMEAPVVPTAGERMASPAREQVARPAVKPAVRPATKPAVRPAAEQLTSPTTQRLAPPVTGRLLRPAADHVVRAVVDQVVRPAADQVVRPVGQRVVGPVVDQVARPVGQRIVRSVAEPVLRPVAGQVLRPVGQLVRGVTEKLGAGTVTVPVPHLPGLPVRLLPAADAVGRPQAPTARATVAPIPDGRAQLTPATHGPAAAPVATPPGTRPTPRPDGQHTAPVARASSPQVFRTPAGGAPDGALGSGSAVDRGTARHGDTGAVPAHHRPTPRLVPGATVRADAPGTRDHTRDVPVPPA
ncbi:hypothetical protein [Streptomyces sp. NPDC085937]|uniref:hypothetical protein n=1 Tax=Streptomyces sp. NPDC085937 TaxID=3365742 RepID=UPI0037D1F6D5